MQWNNISDESQINSLIEDSFKSPQVIFKHSTRCSISVMVKSRLEHAGQAPKVVFHYLDLLNYRSISNFIAEKFAVQHQSPQVLLIKNGECVYDESHNAITMAEIAEVSSL